MRRLASGVDVNKARFGNSSFFTFPKMPKSTKYFEEIGEEFEIRIKRAKKLRKKLLKLRAKLRFELKICQELCNAMDQ